MVSKRYIRDDEIVGVELQKTRDSVKDVQSPTGTEKALTKDVAEQAAVDADFAKQLAEQLEVELGTLPGQIQQALTEAADALEEAGLARSEAATAITKAQDAVDDAVEAITQAQAAATAAAAAQTTANGKSEVVRSPNPATAAGSYQQGDQWWQFSGGNIVGLWLHDGTNWVAQALTNAIIATLDAGKITTGTLAADRIGALSITTAKLAAEAITTEKIAALAVTASELAANSVIATKIAASAVITEKLAAGAVATDKLNALAVTAEKIATGAIIAEKIAAGAITTGKLAATAIDGMTITGALIRTAANGQRMEFSAAGLKAYNSAGAVTGSLYPDTGGMALNGSLSLYGAGSGTNNNSVQLFAGGSTPQINISGPNIGDLRSDVSSYSHGVGSFFRAGLGLGISDFSPAGDRGVSLWLSAEKDGSQIPYTSILQSDGSDLKIGSTANGSRVLINRLYSVFNGGIKPVLMRLEGQVFILSGTTLATATFISKDSSGLVTFFIGAQRSQWNSGATNVATIPEGFRPAGTVNFPAPINGVGTPYIGFGQITPGGTVTNHSSPANGQTWSFNMSGSYKAA